MRGVLATIILASATVASAGETPRNPLGVERSLTAPEVARYAAPYLPAIKQCYLEHAKPAKSATGELALHLTVHRDGEILDVTVDAPGVTGKRLRDLNRCLRTQVATWHFPVRRSPTTAIIPYYFLKLDLPGAGPQLSCWNPRGCPDKPVRSR
jgi:hypothetical protein